MSVLVVTDSSACLPPALAAEYGITVLDFHAEGEGDDETTAGLGALELTACYARLLERGGDDGVVALHISKELSGTWSSASQAAAVLDGRVEVIDTMSAGMVIGQAAIAAARCADEGGSLDECRGVAQHAIDTGQLWMFVNRLDTLAKGGRLTAGQRLLSTALAIKPILHLAGGRLELAAKTRTRSKAMERLVTLAADAYRRVAEEQLPSAGDDGEPEATEAVSGEDTGASEVAEPVRDSSDSAVSADTAGDDPAAAVPAETDPAGEPAAPVAQEGTPDTVAQASQVAPVTSTGGTDAGDHPAVEEDTPDVEPVDGMDADDVSSDGADQTDSTDRPRIFNFGGRDRHDKSERPEKNDKSEKTEKAEKTEHERLRLRRRTEEQVPLEELPRVPMHLAVHHREAEDAAEELRSNLREQLPACVVISVVDVTHSMAVHTGPGALAVSLVQD
ncbi:DegV family protein [Corynebacterium sp.]|uniref:DegV family protein n=1 Tax=Corynebacterium sp. TaxID=1720 RepID=UPI003B3A6239